MFPIPHDINDIDIGFILGGRWSGSGGKFGGGHPMESTDPQLSPEKPIGGEDWRYLKAGQKVPKARGG